MTPPGIGPDRCREALGRYRAGIAELGRLLAADPRQRQFGDALTVLDDLMTSLEVDTLARRGTSSRYRMSTAEAEFFVPAVTLVRRRLGTLSRGRPSGDWLPGLREIDEVLAAADGGVERLEPAGVIATEAERRT